MLISASNKERITKFYWIKGDKHDNRHHIQIRIAFRY